MKYNSYIFKVLMLLAGVGAITSSCEDMLESDSKFVIYDDHLTTPADSANSLVGIIYQLQAIAERTHLLGEVRGDLVSVKSTAEQDLLQMANFEMDDNNAYNNPRDYYAVINNCNYYLAHADLTAVNTSAERIFWREYVQVKAIRAWTYLQLALNYGSVQFYTEPILTEVDASKEYPRKSLEEICDYFIQDLTVDPTYSTTEFPNLHVVGNLLMSNCFFPVDVVLGDLYLWKASITGSQSDYRNAAQRYCAWIFRNGNVGPYNKERYNIDDQKNGWIAMNNGDVTLHENPSIVEDNWSWSYKNLFSYARGENTNVNEMVTIIPMDSLAYQGYYNNMRYFYTNIEQADANGNAALRSTDFYISPSVSLQELSQKQHYAYYYQEGTAVKSFEVPTSTKRPLNNGDIRLGAVWQSFTRDGSILEAATTVQGINKPCTDRDIWIYRKTDLFLRLAEALNNGGYPRLAHMILARGFDGKMIKDSISVYWDEEQKAFYNNVLNANNDFEQYVSRNGFKTTTSSAGNETMGLHSRGCGYAELDPSYAYPAVPSDENAEYQQKKAQREQELTDFIDLYWETFVNTDNEEQADSLQKLYGTTAGFKTAYRNEFGTVTPTKEAVFNKLWNEGQSQRAVADGDYSIAPFKLEVEKWWAAYPGNKETEMRKVDQMILDEMALETSMEGKRFYDLMRHAIRYNDNEIVAEPVSKRSGEEDGALHSRLRIRDNWYMKWNGKMGF